MEQVRGQQRVLHKLHAFGKSIGRGRCGAHGNVRVDENAVEQGWSPVHVRPVRTLVGRCCWECLLMGNFGTQRVGFRNEFIGKTAFGHVHEPASDCMQLTPVLIARPLIRCPTPCLAGIDLLMERVL